MRRSLLLCESKFKYFGVGLVLLLATISHAQAAPKADVSVGYSHLLVTANPNLNMNGGNFSPAVNFDDWVGFIGDLGVYQGSQAGAGVTGITYMVGARISDRKLKRLVPFIQGLAGGAHLSSKLTGSSSSQNPFCYAFGGGVDIGIGRGGKVALRPQVEYVGFEYTTNAGRFSVGLVYSFPKN